MLINQKLSQRLGRVRNPQKETPILIVLLQMLILQPSFSTALGCYGSACNRSSSYALRW